MHKEIPDALYHPTAKLITVNRAARARLKPSIVVICAGTSDISVAEEATLTAEIMDNSVQI